MKRSKYGALSAILLIFLSTKSIAALIDNGGGLIYDDVLNITCAQPENTLRNWEDANTWAAGLTLGGVGGWRLPYVSVAAGAGPYTGSLVDCSTASEMACRDNELGYMFYQNLSGTAGSSILTSGDPDLALFPELQSFSYWSGTAFNTSAAYPFNFSVGSQGSSQKSSGLYTWAVHAGNVSPIPIPAAVWLFSSGIIGLIGISRRKKAA